MRKPTQTLGALLEERKLCACPQKLGALLKEIRLALWRLRSSSVVVRVARALVTSACTGCMSGQQNWETSGWAAPRRGQERQRLVGEV